MFVLKRFGCKKRLSKILILALLVNLISIFQVINVSAGYPEDGEPYIIYSRLTDGDGQFKYTLNTSTYLQDDNTNVQLKLNNYTQHSNYWISVSLGGNKYRLNSSKRLDKVLSMPNGSNNWGTQANLQFNLQSSTIDTPNYQKWIIEDLGNGYHAIKSSYNGLYLDVSGGNAYDSAPIVQ